MPKGDRFRIMKFNFPREFAPVTHLAADDKERLFVTVGGIDETDVFDPEGRLIARIKGVVTNIHRDKVYSILAEEKDGYPIIKRYRIEWK